MSIVFRHLDRVPLDEVATLKVVKKFGKLKKPVVISFDNRIKLCGLWQYKADKHNSYHLIKISPIENMCNNETGALLSDKVQVYELISTILHELRHGQQWENNFSWNGRNHKVKGTFYQEWWSESEIDARTFEHANIAQAIEYYDKNISK